MEFFSTDGLDLSLIEDFKSEADIRSYLVCKFGSELAHKIMAFIPNELTNDTIQTNTRKK